MQRKKSYKYLSVLICFFIICGSILYIPRKNEVKANPILAGMFVVDAIMISCGIYASSPNGKKLSTEIYNALTIEDKTYLDTQGNLVSFSTLNGIKIMPDVYNRVINQIKAKFGTSPAPTYAQTMLGNVATSDLPYSTNTSPINLGAVSSIFTMGQGAFDSSYVYGSLSAHYVKASRNADGDCFLELTCPDGYKVRLDMQPYLTDTDYYPNGIGMLIPVVYGANTPTPDIKFMAHGFNPRYWQPEYINPMQIRQWDSVTAAWVGMGDLNLYNTLTAHMGVDAATTANIDTAVYSERTSVQATDDMALQVSQNFDTMAKLSAAQITSTDNVGNNVLNIGADIVNGLNNIGNTLVNAFDSAIGAATDAINVGIGVIDGALADLKAAEGAIGQTITDAVTAVGVGVQSIGKTITDAVVAVGEGIQSIGLTIADTFAKVGEIANSIVEPASIPINTTPLVIAGSVVSTRFPFSIPFDFINSIRAFNVSAAAPHFVWDFPSNYFVGGGQIDINFSQFEQWAVIIRWSCMLSFSIGLILLTRGIIGGE